MQEARKESKEKTKQILRHIRMLNDQRQFVTFKQRICSVKSNNAQAASKDSESEAGRTGTAHPSNGYEALHPSGRLLESSPC